MKDGTVTNLDSNHGNNDSQKAIRKDTKGSRRKLAIRNGIDRFKLRRHDKLLHVSPSQVRGLKTRKGEKKLEGLQEELWIAGAVLNNEAFDKVSGHNMGIAHGNLSVAVRSALYIERLHLLSDLVHFGFGADKGRSNDKALVRINHIGASGHAE
jgi:hypothetical protein